MVLFKTLMKDTQIYLINNLKLSSIVIPYMAIQISLRPQDIRAYSSLEKKLPKTSLERFKSLCEGGCHALDLSSGWGTAVSVNRFAQAMATGPMPSELCNTALRLLLPEDIRMGAMDIILRENRKLRDSGVQGSWIDGEKLAVRSIMKTDGRASPDIMKWKADDLSLEVSMMKWSEILALKGLPFDEIADYGAFKLDTNTHVVARENAHDLLLVGHRGRKPGEPRMGSEALLAPARDGTQWTLATNGTIDAELLGAGDPNEVWINNSTKEFSEELGVSWDHFIDYLGLIVDTKMFVGAIGIVGVIQTSLMPEEIDEIRKLARDAVEVSKLDAIPLESGSLAQYLRVNRSNMVPQLVTSIAMLGYSRFGDGFLKLADK